MITFRRGSPFAVWNAPHDQQSGELTLRAGGGLERQLRHPRRLAQSPLQRPEELERSGAEIVVRHRMKRGEPRQGRDVLGDLGVVLHRARAQRIRPDVDRPVALRQARVVTDQVPLAHLGERRWPGPAVALGDQVVEGWSIHLDLGQRPRSPTVTGQLEDQRERILQRSRTGRRLQRASRSVAHRPASSFSIASASLRMSSSVRFSVTDTSRQSSSADEPAAEGRSHEEASLREGAGQLASVDGRL